MKEPISVQFRSIKSNNENEEAVNNDNAIKIVVINTAYRYTFKLILYFIRSIQS